VWFVPGQRAIHVPTPRVGAFGESPDWAALSTISASRHTSFSFLISSISRRTLLIIASFCGPGSRQLARLEICSKNSTALVELALAIGHAAFDAAISSYPDQRFTLWNGILVTREHAPSVD
jgi:hypothetical protein